jgi:hypothetical protein
MIHIVHTSIHGKQGVSCHVMLIFFCTVYALSQLIKESITIASPLNGITGRSISFYENATFCSLNAKF